jgi:kynureninase
VSLDIESQVAKLGVGPLTESGLREHIWPLFSRVIEGCSRRNEIYLANHSLGRPLDQVEVDVLRGLELWYSRMDDSWDDDAWPAAIENFRSQVAKLIGLSDAKAVIPKTSAGQGLRAVLNALPADGSNRPIRVVATRGEFDSIDFILKTYSKKGRADVTWVEPSCFEQGVPLFDSDSIIGAIKSGTDLVVVSQVVFSTGQVIPNLSDIVAAAHSVGAMCLVDAYHAVGVIPVQIESLGADFMIGGSYKYTRGGPGACWLAIHPRHLNTPLRTLDTGWFAKKDKFSYKRSDEPELAEGGDAWLESTPPVLVMYQAASGLKLTLGIGVERLREYNLKQQAILREAFAEIGVICYVPADARKFGAFSLVPTTDSAEICKSLKATGVNTDSRNDCIRFGPDILNSEQELREAARIAGMVLAR